MRTDCSTSTTSVAAVIADSVVTFIADTVERNCPPEVLDAARLCLVDWTGATVGGSGEPAGILIANTFQDTTGRALVLAGGTADARMAALINGTCAHSLDFDDTHVASLSNLDNVVGDAWGQTSNVTRLQDAIELGPHFVR